MRKKWQNNLIYQTKIPWNCTTGLATWFLRSFLWVLTDDTIDFFYQTPWAGTKSQLSWTSMRVKKMNKVKPNFWWFLGQKPQAKLEPKVDFSSLICSMILISCGVFVRPNQRPFALLFFCPHIGSRHLCDKIESSEYYEYIVTIY